MKVSLALQSESKTNNTICTTLNSDLVEMTTCVEMG